MPATSTWAPWEALHGWAPFNIDALGLVTLLGAEEINAAVGRLVSSSYLEYLPLLGAFVIAGDRFVEKAPGFNLYNISQGIRTTNLAGWLTRWMLSQGFETTRSFVVWKITPPQPHRKQWIISCLIGFVFNGFLVALTVLSRDWYGLANAIAMIVSILVRAYVIGEQRAGINAMVDDAIARAVPPPKDGSYEALRHEWKSWKTEIKQRKRPQNDAPRNGGPQSLQSSSSGDDAKGPKQANQATQIRTGPTPTRPSARKYRSESWSGTDTKVLIIQSDSKAVSFWMPAELLRPPSVFVEGPRLLHPRKYFVVRSIGWLFFAVHIVAIGMANLAAQLYTVVLLVLPSILLVLKLGCDDSEWTRTIRTLNRKFYNWCRARDEPSGEEAAEAASSGEFVKIRECWIGSRLKAEISEWPVSYEFQEEAEGEGTKWKSGVPPNGTSRSTKRQDLYAWLALSHDEEESMDKWDLFPHIRNDNTLWWRTYKKKKHCLKCNPNFGPQTVLVTDAEREEDKVPDGYRQQGRTSTINFDDEPAMKQANVQGRTTSVVIQSSAFPAISDHELSHASGSENIRQPTGPTPILHESPTSISRPV